MRGAQPLFYVVTYTRWEPGESGDPAAAGPSRPAAIAAEIWREIDAGFVVGRLAGCSLVRSLRAHAVLSREKYCTARLWLRPSLDAWWITSDGEYECLYAHDVIMQQRLEVAELGRCGEIQPRVGLELGVHPEEWEGVGLVEDDGRRGVAIVLDG